MIRKSKKKSVSIIIPTLNEEKYLPKLLLSLTKQTTKDFEVIVVDGNSNDLTKIMAKHFLGKLDIKIINSNQKNVSFQRNLGAKRAKSDLFIFMDADNIVRSDFVAKTLNEIKEKHAELASPHLFLNGGNLYERFFFANIRFFMVLFSKIKPFGLGICIITSKGVHERGKGFDHHIKFCEDLEYIKRKSCLTSFMVIQSKIYTSPRRFEKYGTKKTIKLWMKGYFYHLLKGNPMKIEYKKV